MKQGTTPTHTFMLPFDTSIIKTVKVLYEQNGALILEKNKDDCVLEGETISLTMTQEDTFQFKDAKGFVYIQLRILTLEGVALASDLMATTVDRCLDKEVLR